MVTLSRSHITTTVLREVLPTRDLGNHVLIVDDTTDTLSDQFLPHQKHTFWNRYYHPQRAAHTWPSPGNYSAAIIRLPKSHDAFDMILHAVSSVTAKNAPLIIYGMTDEGIKGAKKKLQVFFGAADTLLFKKRCHVLATQNTPQEDIQTHLSDFAKIASLSYHNNSYPTTFYPGMFAAKTLDPGTALLLDAALPHISDDLRVLDYGCGSGIITRVLQDYASHLDCTLLDNDSVALAAAEKNCADAHTILSDSLHGCEGYTYDLIISNPPMHTEKTEHTAIIENLIINAPTHLRENGQFIIVVQSRLNLTLLCEKHFSSHAVIAHNTHYTVWHGKN